jgi:predicted GTPase
MSYTVEENKQILRSSGINPVLAELIPDVSDLLDKCNRQNLDTEQIERTIDRISDKYNEYKEIRDSIGPSLYQYLVVRGLYPIRIVGLGQAGAGKTKIIQKIFSKFNDKVKDIFQEKEIEKEGFKTSAADDGTLKPFNYDFAYEGKKIRFTDVAGFGGNRIPTYEAYQMCKPYVDKADMVYYVFGQSRSWENDKKFMEMIVKDLPQKDAKNILLILNQIDITPLDSDDDDPWDPLTNTPTRPCLDVIEEKKKVIASFAKSFKIDKENIVECSAKKSYNLDEVFRKLFEVGSDNSKRALIGTMDNAEKLTSLENVKNEVAKKVLQMDADTIREELRLHDIGKDYKRMLENRLREISNKEKFKSFLKKITLIEPAQKILEHITKPVNPFNERKDGYKLQKQIYQDFYELLRLDRADLKVLTKI